MHPRTGILVIQSLGLGDVLFALPVLTVLKQAFPDEPITFLTHAHHAELFSLVPQVAEVLCYDRKTPRAIMQLVQAVRRRRYRMAVVLNPVFRGAVLAWCAGIPQRVGYLRDYERKQSLWGLGRFLLTHPFLPQEKKIHEVERYLNLARMFGLEMRPEDALPRLKLTQEAKDFGHGVTQSLCENGEKPLVALLPGGGWKMRWWPADRFAAIGDWLAAAYGARILLLGSKEEESLAEQVRSRMKQPAVSYAGETTLTQLAGVLSRCSLLLSNDTGVVHLAAALDIPVLALFGPGDPVKVRPLSEQAVVIHHPVPWGPCRVQYTNRCRNNLCMKDIPIEEIQEAIREILGKERFPTAVPEPRPTSAGLTKKILFLQSTSEISGTDITLLRTLEVLDRSRFEPHVVLFQKGPFGEEFRRAGCRVHLVPSMLQLSSHRGPGYLLRCLLGYPAAVFRIAALARREGIHLIHTNTIHNPYGFLVARLAGVPHLWHIREIIVQSPLVRFTETRLVQWFSSRFLVMDNAIAEMFLKPGGGLPANIAKLYDGVDLEAFNPRVSGSRIRRELGIEEGAPLVGMVARLDPAKGSNLFLEIAARVHAKVPSCRFFLCGGEIRGHEGMEQRLRQQAAALGIQDVVFFTGWTYRHRDIPEVYGALDVSLQCPALPEAYGLAYVEAMASGVPIVAFAQGGPAELCVNRETAWLVQPGDVAGAAGAVENLLRDPKKARAMGEAARNRAEARFDRRRCVRELEALYESILGGNGTC